LKKGTAIPVTKIGDAVDTTIYSSWLSNTIEATRQSWDDEILIDRENDCVIFFYSSQHISYQQRGFAYQYSRAVDRINEYEAIY